LEKVILRSVKSNYDYLIDLSDRKKSAEATADRKIELQELQDKLEELRKEASEGRFKGSSIWKRELDQLEEMIKQGRDTDWLYGDKKKFQFK
jgi:hypothetical protein